MLREWRRCRRASAARRLPLSPRPAFRLSRLPVRALIRSAFAFALDRAGWRETLRLGWPALLLYGGLSLWEAMHPPEDATGPLGAIAWSAFALTGLTAAALRAHGGRAGETGWRRWLSLSLWVLVWSLLLGAGLGLLGAGAVAAVLGLIAALPEAAREGFLAPFRASPALAAGAALALGLGIACALIAGFVRLYLIVPAAAADRAVSWRGAWRIGRGETGRLLLVFLVTVILIDLAANAAASAISALVERGGGEAAARTGFLLATLVYNGLALVANQIAAAGWGGAHRWLARRAEETAENG